MFRHSPRVSALEFTREVDASDRPIAPIISPIISLNCADRLNCHEGVQATSLTEWGVLFDTSGDPFVGDHHAPRQAPIHQLNSPQLNPPQLKPQRLRKAPQLWPQSHCERAAGWAARWSNGRRPWRPPQTPPLSKISACVVPGRSVDRTVGRWTGRSAHRIVCVTRTLACVLSVPVLAVLEPPLYRYPQYMRQVCT